MLLSLIFALGYCGAQSLSASVVASTGGQFTSAFGSLDWTLGEIMTETYQNTNGIFSQGFQQPNTFNITGLEEAMKKNILIYPIPTYGELTLDFKGLDISECVVELIDLQGRKLLSKPLQINAAQRQHKLSLVDMAASLYLLRIQSTTSSAEYSFRIVKIN
jgi:Secretion system C-terminal sorting domain